MSFGNRRGAAGASPRMRTAPGRAARAACAPSPGPRFGRKALVLAVCALAACLCAGAAFATGEAGNGRLAVSDKAPFEVRVAEAGSRDACGAAEVAASGEATGLEAAALDSEDQPVDATYQWQILVDAEAGLWADIQGQGEAAIALTRGVVSGALDADGAAQVRCTAVSESGEAVSSDPVEVTVGEVVEGAAAAAAAADGDAVDSAAQSAPEAFSGVRAARSGGVALLDAGSGKYTVTVKYVYEDGTPAAQDVVYEVAPGDSFTDNVKFPSKAGYKPYVGDEQKDSIELSYDDVSENITVAVVYKPVDVSYTVVHHQQNVGDDKYTEFDSETKQAKTGTAVGGSLAKTYEGFYSLPYSSDAKVAGDGSTVVNIYYDRNYYLMKFDMDGGYGTEPVYARYGANIDEVADPVKAGYAFVGWSETEGGTTAVDLPETMPADNKTYHAIWEANGTAKVTIVFWGENADDEGYSYLSDYTKVINLKPGSSFTYSEGDILVCGKDEHTHGEGCSVSCGKEEHTHSDGCRMLTCDIENHTHSDACYTGRHTHGIGCYAGVGSQHSIHLSAPSDPKNGQVYHSDGFIGIASYTIIYIDGVWYNYSGSTNSGSIAPTTCGKEESVGALTCGKDETHYHSADCYDNVGNEQRWDPDGAPSNPVDGQIYVTTTDFPWGSSTTRYIYISGTWYYYSANANNGAVVDSTCGNTGPHVHTDACYTPCEKEEHAHVAACYSCGKEAHSHNSDCYMQGVGLDSKLWKFVKSDSVTVAGDGSTVVNVYYDRVEYSVQFYENQNCSSNREYTSLKITAKWGQNILDKWPTYNGSSSWYVKDKSDTWQNSIQVMPVGGAKFWGPKSGNNKYTATYYVEILDGEEYDVPGSDGRYYKVHHTDTSNSSGNVTDEERYGIDGFTINNSISTSNGSSYGGSKFYYTRNSYKLTFNDQFSDVKEESVKYEAPLSTYKDYEPDAPGVYPPGLMEFGGWYQNPQCTGEEYKLEEHTMPSNDVILYAKWVPIKMTVNFYLDKDAYDGKSGIEGYTDVKVDYGSKLAAEQIPTPAKDGYEFVGWFYMENGVEKAFDFGSMEVRKNLDVYGKWKSDVTVPYVVSYVLEADNSVKVADDDVAYGLAGSTKTVSAKTGNGLYENCRGCTPTRESTSIVLSLEKVAEPKDGWVFYDPDGDGEGEYVQHVVFEYKADLRPYTVYYVTKEAPSGVTLPDVVEPTVTLDGKTYYRLAEDAVDAVNVAQQVVVNAKDIEGYKPDEESKTKSDLAAGNDPSANQIVFVYERNTTSLTIEKKAAEGTAFADGETFVFTVTGDNLPSSGMQVVISGADVKAGEGSVTIDGLKVGSSYTVAEDGNWSWRYTPDAASKTSGALVANPSGAQNTVTFTNTKTDDKWLDFSGWCRNLFKGSGAYDGVGVGQVTGGAARPAAQAS